MINKESAREIAAKELRFKIGHLPYIKDEKVRVEEEYYIFPIYYRYTDIPQDEDDEVRYSEERKIGVIKVSKEDGKIKRTSNDQMEENVVEVKEKVKLGDIGYID